MNGDRDIQLVGERDNSFRAQAIGGEALVDGMHLQPLPPPLGNADPQLVGRIAPVARVDDAEGNESPGEGLDLLLYFAIAFPVVILDALERRDTGFINSEPVHDRHHPLQRADVKRILFVREADVSVRINNQHEA